MKKEQTSRIFSQIGFLVWIVDRFGYQFTATYYQISANTGGRIVINTVKNWLRDLEKYGFISISDKHRYKRTYTVNKEVYENVVRNNSLALVNLIHIDDDGMGEDKFPDWRKDIYVHG